MRYIGKTDMASRSHNTRGFGVACIMLACLAGGWMSGVHTGIAAPGASSASDAGTIPPSCFQSPAQVHEVAPGIFVRHGLIAEANAGNIGAIANIGFIVGKTSVAVVDTGGSACDGAHLHAAIRARTDLPIAYVINTHMHPDHVLGNAAFVQDDPVFIGHKRLPEALGARASDYIDRNRALIGADKFAGTRIILPAETVDGAMQLDLGGRVIELRAFSTAHTDNDLTVWDANTSVLFAGDLVFLEHIPVIDGSLKGWLKVIGQLAQLPVARVVPGHGPVSAPWPQALEPEKRYLTALRDDIRKLIKDGGDLKDAAEAAAPKEKLRWRLYEDFHVRNANTAYAELEWE